MFFWSLINESLLKILSLSILSVVASILWQRKTKSIKLYQCSYHISSDTKLIFRFKVLLFVLLWIWFLNVSLQLTKKKKKSDHFWPHNNTEWPIRAKEKQFAADWKVSFQSYVCLIYTKHSNRDGLWVFSSAFWKFRVFKHMPQQCRWPCKHLSTATVKSRLAFLLHTPPVISMLPFVPGQFMRPFECISALCTNKSDWLRMLNFFPF